MLYRCSMLHPLRQELEEKDGMDDSVLLKAGIKV